MTFFKDMPQKMKTRVIGGDRGQIDLVLGRVGGEVR